MCDSLGGGSELSDTVAWIYFDVPSVFASVIDEATLACERVRALARLEQRHDVFISDAVFTSPFFAMVTVRAPQEDLERWLARVVIAISDPLVEAGVDALRVTERGSAKVRLTMELPDVRDGFVEGILRDTDPGATEFLENGALRPDVVAALRPDPNVPRAAVRTRERFTPLPRTEIARALVRRGFVRWPNPGILELCTIDQARAALSTLDGLPDGYEVADDHLVVVDEQGVPRAVIDWGAASMFHRPNGFEVRREQRLFRIASRRYEPRLGHLVVEPGPRRGVKLDRRVRETIFEPLGPDQRLVMIDSSVMWSTMREGMPPDTVIMFHTALAMDIIMAEYGREFDPMRAALPTAQSPFFDGLMISQDLPREPIAPSRNELEVAAGFMQTEGRLAAEQDREARLTRTDAISAVLAISMGVPLLTRVPEIYEGISSGGGLVLEDLGPEPDLGAT